MTEQINFDHGYSAANAAAVLAELDGQCNCQPYQDVFTFQGWKKMGFNVIKGQTCHIRVTVFKTSQKKDDAGKVTETKSWPKTSCLFCRCQVEETKVKK